MPKVLGNMGVLESKITDANAKVDAVVSSVVITYVLTKHNVFPADRYEILLKCLKLACEEEACNKFIKNVDEFNDVILR